MENSLHYKLRACHTSCQRAIVARMKEQLGLRPGEPKILEFLAEHEPCEQKAIAAGCGLDSASVTGILHRMEERNLVKRESKNGNRRSLYVSMTTHGRDICQKSEIIFSQVDTAALTGLSDADIDTLMHLLEHIQANITALESSQLH